MLSRPATKIQLTPDDIVSYEQRKATRDAARNQQDLENSQESDMSTVANAEEQKPDNVIPPTQTRAARVKMSREQRIGVGNTRG